MRKPCSNHVVYDHRCEACRTAEAGSVKRSTISAMFVLTATLCCVGCATKGEYVYWDVKGIDCLEHAQIVRDVAASLWVLRAPAGAYVSEKRARQPAAFCTKHQRSAPVFRLHK